MRCVPQRFETFTTQRDQFRQTYDSAVAEIAISTVTGVSLSANTKLNYETFLQGTGTDFGTASGTVTVMTTDDNTEQGADRTVTVSASFPFSFSYRSSFPPYSYWRVGWNTQPATATATLTIRDNDSPGLQVSKTAVATSEAATTDTFTVQLQKAPTAAVTVAVASNDIGEATVSPMNLSFTTVNYNTPQTVTVTGVDDSMGDGDEPYSITLTSSSTDTSYNNLTATVSGTNTDNDAPAVSLSLSASSISENGGMSIVSASLTRTSTAATTVTVTPKLRIYTVGSPDAITIPVGQTSGSGTVTITAVNNTTDAPDLSTTVTATARNTSALGVTGPAAVSLTITDDDAAPTASLSLSDASISENGATTEVSARLSHPSSADTTVVVSAVPGLYTVESDATIVIAAGATTDDETVTITTANNTVDEANRTVTVTGRASNTQGIASQTVTGATLTLEDDDDPPTVSLTLDDSSIAEDGGTAEVSATLSHASDTATVVTVTEVDGHYEVPSVLADRRITIAAGETTDSGTVTITAEDNTRDEPNRSAAITGMATNGRGVGAVSGATLTLEDDDAAPGVALSVSPGSISEDGGTATVSASLTGGTTSSAVTTVTVTVSATEGYTVPSGANTITIAAGSSSGSGTVTITAEDNDVDAADLMTTVTGMASNSQGLASTTATVASLTVTDDDDAALTVSKTTVSTSEDGAPAMEGDPDGRDTFTVRLATAPTATVTVTITSSKTTEARVSPASIRFGAVAMPSANPPVYKWDDARTVTVTGVDDANPEASQSYTITVAATSPGSGGDAIYHSNTEVQDVTVSGTNADNDAPTVSLALGSTTINESGMGNSTTVSASLSTTSTAATTVRVTVSETGGYTVGSSGTITIPVGQTAGDRMVTITAADNDVDAADLSTTVTAEATNTSALGVSGPAAVSLTITDDDTAGLSASKTAVSTTEASGAGRSETFTVELDTEPTATVTVAVGVTGGDTDEASASPTSISFGATANTGANPPVYKWDDARTVTVTGADDDVDDGDRTYTVTLNPDSAAGMSGDANYRDSVATAEVSGTNADDDTAGLTLSKNSVATGEDGTTDSFTVALATEPTAQVTVTIASSDTNEATVSPGTLTFAAAADTSDSNNPVYKWNDARTVTVTGVDDSVDEDDKTYTITVNPDSAAGMSGDAKYRDDVATASVPGTNADDDDEPTVGIDSPSVPEGNSGETDLTFTVSLSAASGKQVTVDYAVDGTDGGTATAGADYAALAAGTLTFAAGETRKTVPVRVRGDTAEESDETVRLTLSGPVNATLDPAKTTGTGTIRDDDGMELTVSKTAVSTSEPAETDDFTVRLAAAPSATVTVSVSVAGGDTDEAAVSPSSIRFGARAMPGASPPVYKWDDPRTVTVTGRDDDVDDGDRSYAITLSSSSSDAGYNNLLKTVSGTNADDDTAGLTTSKSMVLTGEDGSTDTFTVRLATEPTAAVTVAVAIGGTDPDEATANPGTLTFSTMNWDTPQTVTVTGADDADADGERPYTVTLTAASTDAGYSGLSASVSGRNGDNEGAALWVSRTAVTTSEPSGTDDFTVRLATAPSAAVTVSVSVTGGDTDEAAVSLASITFGATAMPGASPPVVLWSAAQTVTVTGADDSVDDDDRSYTITVSSSSSDTNYNSLSHTVSGTNTDDEAAPTVTLSLSRGEIKEAAGAQASERRATVTARLSHATREATTLTVSAAAGANAAADDFTLSGTTLTIDAGETSSADADTAAHRQVTITAVDDRVDSLVATDGQGNAITAKLVTVSGSVSGGNGAAAPRSATLRIAEDDFRGLVFTPALPRASRRCARLRPPPGCPSLIYRTVDESGNGNTATFQVKLATQPTSPVSVAVSSADEGEGLVSQSGDAAPARTTTLRFTTGNWNTNQTVTLTGVDDRAVDDNQDYLVRLNPNAAATDAYSLAPRAQALMRTTDTNTAGLTVSETSVSTSEASGTARTDDFTVRLDTIPSATVTVDVASSAADEAGVSPSSIKFGAAADADNSIFAWNDPQTVTVTGADDDAQDGSQTYSVTLDPSSSDTNYDGLDTVSVSGTNADDDDAALTVSKTSVSTGEDGTTDDFTVRLATEPTGTVTVTVTSSKTTEATVSPGTLTFAAAADTSDSNNPVYKWDDPRMVTVTGVDDANPEAAQSYTITVAATSPGSGGDAIYHSNTEVPDVTVSGTNADNDAPTVTLALSATSISEDGGTSQVSASLSRMSTHDTTVTVTSKPGVYTAPSSANTITIDAGETTSMDRVTITAVDNDVDAADLSTTVSATADNAPAALRVSNPADVSLTITDDDTAGLTASKSSVSTTEASGAGRSETFTVELDTEPTATVTVAVGVTGGDTDEATVSPTSITFAAAADSSDSNNPVYKWDDARTVTVTGADDDVDDGDRTYTVTLNPDSAAGMSGDANYRDSVATAEVSGTNADDDDAALTVSETSVSTGEDGTTDDFTVRLATEPTGTVTVTVTSSKTTEATVSPGTLRFAAAADTATDPANPVYKWDDPRMVTVTGVDDANPEAAQSYTITVAATSPGSGGDAIYHSNTEVPDVTVSGTNADNDAPTVTLTLGSATINESGAGNSTTVSASLSTTSTHATTVRVEVSSTGGYAVGSQDTITIPAGQTAGNRTVTVTAEDNDVDAPDLSTTVTAEATNTSALGVSGPAAVALTIADDDAAPTASLSLSDASIAENGGTAEVSATLNRASSEDTTVTVTAVSGHYTVPSTPANRQITIAAGSTTSSDRVTITAANNMRDEANRQARVAATAVNSQGLSNTPCTTATPPVCTVTGPQLTLEDDDTGPSVTLSVASATIAESGAGNTTTVSAALTGGTSDADTTVTIADVAGAYTAPSSANTITIAAGATNGSGTVTITAVDDTRDEPGTTTVTGSATNTRSAAAGAAVPVTGASLTVTDDDDPPVVTLTAAPASIAESGTGNTAQVAATLTGTSSAATVVTVTDAGGGYTVPATANTITIAADQTSSSDRVTVTAADNSVDAADLATTVTGTAANAQATADGTTVTVTAGSLTITDDDTAALTLSKTSVTTSEDGAPASPGDPDGRDTFTVRLATQPTAAVTVVLSSSDTDEATVSPASLTFTPSTPATLWSAPQTVTVTGVDDTPPDQDGLKTYTITLNPDSHATTGDANYRGLASVIVNGRNRDNEAPTVTLSLSPETISENGGAATLTAGLDGPVPEATTVTVAAAPGAGAAAGDFRLSGTTLRIPANATASENALTITAVDNRVDAPDKTVALSATVSGGQGAAAPDPRTLTITDDEAAPTVTLTAASAAIWEDGGTTTVSARLSHASAAATTVTVRGVAELYEVVGRATILIPAGALTGSTTVTIRALDNAERAAADRVAVIAGMASNTHSELGGGTTTVAAARVTVWDDETASVSLLLEPERVAEGAVARVSARLTRPARAAVTLTVSAAAGTNATAASFALGPERTLTVPAGATASAGVVEIAAVDDEVDAPDRAVTITAAVASSVRARTPEPVTLSIEDDDEAPQAALVLRPAAIDESGETNAATVSATLSHPSSAATTIAVSAAGTGFRQQGTTLTIPALGTASAASVTLTAVDDETHNEDREVTVSGRAENAQGIEQPAAVVLTIRDDDGTEEVTAALLPEAARAMADSRAAAVRQRLERADAAGASGLPTLTGLLERHGPSAQEEGLEWKKSLLPQASFALPLDAEGGGGGLTLWGGGDYRDLDGEAGGVKWDGEAASAHVGADRLLANGLRLGLAASWSEARFDYEHRNRKGEWDLEMTSAQPYLGWTTPGGVALWASAGYGSGELEIAPENGRRQTSDADMRMAAAGARGPLYAADGLEVSLRGEALYAKFEVDGNGAGIAAHDSDVSRLRLAVEARRERALESGAAVSPWLELGARHDGGDGATGAGAELGAGVDYASGRLELSLGARALAAHSDYDEWGADLSLAYAPGADGRGLAFRLAPSWGATDSGAAELWASGAPGLNEAATEPELGGRLEAELGYGLKSPLGRGLLTLTAGGEWGEDADAVCRLSGVAALDASASLGLELELRRPPSGGTERSLMLTAELRF